MKRKISLALLIILVVGLFNSWQVVNAATGYGTVKVGQQKTFYLSVSDPVNSAAWYVAGDNFALDIVSQNDYSCTVIGMAPTSTRAILRCDYNYIEYRNGFPYMRTGYYDYYIDVLAVAPSSVSVSPESVELVEGAGRQLRANVSPTGATTDLSWSSSNSSVVSVTADGWITAKREGSANVTVTTDNGKSDYCVVTVSPGLRELKLEAKTSMIVGENKSLNLDISPSNASGFSVSWLSSDSDVVKISSQTNYSATLIAVGDGTAEITASSNSKTASCMVTVTRPKPTSVSLPETVVLLAQASKKLVPEILPAEADKSVEWSSNNEKVVKVDDDGTITGIDEGIAIITAKTSNGLEAKCEVTVTLRIPQTIEVSAITAKTYGDEGFKVEVTPDAETGLTEITYSSSNPDVAEIDAEGNVTIKNAGKTNITVSQAGDDTYAPFNKTQELVVNKREITITADSKFKKVNADDPELTYTVTGELVAGDEITGEIEREEGEDIGTYDITIGTLAINDNYDITFAGAVFEIVDKTPQNIVVSEIGEKIYGDASFKVEVTPDAESGLTEITYSSSNTDVAEVDAEGNVTIKAAGEADITVKQAGNEEYAAFENTQKLVVNKKSITVTAIDFENKTAILEGVLDADTAVALDFGKIKLEIGEDVDETTLNVTATNLVLTGEKAENYIVTTESVASTIAKENVVTVSAIAEKGMVDGVGVYVKGSEITLSATADKGYKFKGWYDGEALVSEDAEYTFVADEAVELVAEFKRASSGKYSGGGSSTVASYKVNFVTNGAGSIASQTITKDGAAKMPEAPAKEGFVFGGWYSDKDLTTKYDFDAKITKSITLFAKWFDIKDSIILTIGEKKAKVFGEEKENDVAPKLVNSRTMLPARFVAENLGAEVIWTAEEMDKVVIKNDDVEIIIYIGSDKAYVNGEEVTLDSPAFLENDRTYTPIRFISEEIGADVEWINETQEVVITVK